jgi:hypothetical protein
MHRPSWRRYGTVRTRTARHTSAHSRPRRRAHMINKYSNRPTRQEPGQIRVERCAAKKHPREPHAGGGGRPHAPRRRYGSRNCPLHIRFSDCIPRNSSVHAREHTKRRSDCKLSDATPAARTACTELISVLGTMLCRRQSSFAATVAANTTPSPPRQKGMTRPLLPRQRHAGALRPQLPYHTIWPIAGSQPCNPSWIHRNLQTAFMNESARARLSDIPARRPGPADGDEYNGAPGRQHATLSRVGHNPPCLRPV